VSATQVRAADLVAEIVDIFAASEREWVAMPHVAGYLAGQVFSAVAHDMVGTPMRKPFDPKGVMAAMTQLGSVANEVLLGSREVAARLLWQQARATYDVDLDLWEELEKTAPDDELPADLFTRLPHPNPFIAFPESITLRLNEDGDYQRIVGVFVCGRQRPGDIAANKGKTGVTKIDTISTGPDPAEANMSSLWGLACSTSAERLAGLTLTFVGFTFHANGRPIMAGDIRDLNIVHTSVDLRDGETFGEMVTGAVQRFRGTSPITARISRGRADTEIPLLISRAIGVLVYLCCENADLRPVPASQSRPRRVGRGGKTVKPPKVVRVGYQLGPMLRAYKKRIAEEASSTGRTVKPHLRRAHIHTFRRGPGHSERFTKWLHPILVNMDKDAEMTTVVPVKKRGA
jgi:hypothetical protein